jgi:hypothetical protein
MKSTVLELSNAKIYRRVLPVLSSSTTRAVLQKQRKVVVDMLFCSTLFSYRYRRTLHTVPRADRTGRERAMRPSVNRAMSIRPPARPYYDYDYPECFTDLHALARVLDF